MTCMLQPTLNVSVCVFNALVSLGDDFDDVAGWSVLFVTRRKYWRHNHQSVAFHSLNLSGVWSVWGWWMRMRMR